MTQVNTAHSESGFVLPYVLLVVAILAIAGTIAAQRLQSASAIVTDIGDRLAAERQLQSAEAAATYSILTANALRGGHDISPDSPTVWEFGYLSADGRRPLSEDEASALVPDIWLAQGSLRKYQSTPDMRPTIVSYRDATGLVSLNLPSPRFIEPVLLASGASRAQARSAVSTLLDYTDLDITRRQQGAESFDYRTRDMPAPTNSPLRSYSELGNIMGWSELLTEIDMTRLKDMTTLQITNGYKQGFAPRALQEVMSFDSDSLLESRRLDALQEIERRSLQPSKSSRFVIWAPRADGRYQKRVVDIERFAGGVGAPYRRHWVYDSTVLENDIISAAPDTQTGNSSGSGLNFEELDNVVHAPSLRP
jgi:type II secretory pathway pseudopilin PulG